MEKQCKSRSWDQTVFFPPNCHPEAMWLVNSYMCLWGLRVKLRALATQYDNWNTERDNFTSSLPHGSVFSISLWFLLNTCFLKLRGVSEQKMTGLTLGALSSLLDMFTESKTSKWAFFFINGERYMQTLCSINQTWAIIFKVSWNPHRMTGPFDLNFEHLLLQLNSTT